MNKFLSGLMAMAIAASFAIASVIPLNATPMPAPSVPSASQDVQQVRTYRRANRTAYRVDRRYARRDYRANRRDYRVDRRYDRRDYRRDRRYDRRDYRVDRRYARQGYRTWRGYRGYPHYRNGYREYNGWWYPLAAFTTGAVIGNAINDGYYNNGYYDNGSYGVGKSYDTQWCYNRYRSYRAYDNTYQPYNGPRRQCYSPYG